MTRLARFLGIAVAALLALPAAGAQPLSNPAAAPPSASAASPLFKVLLQAAVEAGEAAAKEADKQAAQARPRQAAAQKAAIRAREAAEKAEAKAKGYGILTGTGTAESLPTWRYAGQVAAAKENGVGVETWSSGERNEGEFKNDEENGVMVSVYPGGTHYEGEFKNAQRSGLGVYMWPDGDLYEGEFKEASRNGAGVYRGGETKDFALKSGQWLNGRLTGYAVVVEKSGNREVGAFRDDKLDGYGATFDAQGTLIEQGLYEDGVIKTALPK